MNREEIEELILVARINRCRNVKLEYIESILSKHGYIMSRNIKKIIHDICYLNININGLIFDFDPIKSCINMDKFLLYEYENCTKQSLYIIGEYLNKNMKLFISGDSYIYGARKYNLYRYTKELPETIVKILLNQPDKTYVLE